MNKGAKIVLTCYIVASIQWGFILAPLGIGALIFGLVVQWCGVAALIIALFIWRNAIWD